MDLWSRPSWLFNSIWNQLDDVAPQDVLATLYCFWHIGWTNGTDTVASSFRCLLQGLQIIHTPHVSKNQLLFFYKITKLEIGMNIILLNVWAEWSLTMWLSGDPFLTYFCITYWKRTLWPIFWNDPGQSWYLLSTAKPCTFIYLFKFFLNKTICYLIRGH